MVTKDVVLEALKDCYDPEIPVNIVDLGLIYDVAVKGERVDVRITMTAPGCPLHSLIQEDAHQRLLRIPGVSQANVEIVWDPPWEPSRITTEGRQALGWPS